MGTLALWAALLSIAPERLPADTEHCCRSLPAMATTLGDAGLWLTPSPETPTAGQWSASGYRSTFDRAEGRTNIAYLGVTGSIGLTSRLELFGTWRADTRIDRDSPDPSAGGPNDHPFAVASWSGNAIGDTLIGAKFNLTSYHRGEWLSAAVRAGVQLATGDTSRGIGTGRSGWWADFVVGRPVGLRGVLDASIGIDARGRPSGLPVGRSLRWSAGTAWDLLDHRAITTSVTAEITNDQIVGTLPAWIVRRNVTDLIVGVVGRTRSGLYVGVGARVTPSANAARAAIDVQGTFGYRLN